LQTLPQSTLPQSQQRLSSPSSRPTQSSPRSNIFSRSNAVHVPTAATPSRVKPSPFASNLSPKEQTLIATYTNPAFLFKHVPSQQELDDFIDSHVKKAMLERQFKN
jgi:hypothetical protein